jgi:hypothetical protein
VEFLLLFETYHYFSLDYSHLVLIDASVQDCKQAAVVDWSKAEDRAHAFHFMA